MKLKTFSIPVEKNRISILKDPTGHSHNTIHAYVRMADLPLDLPMDVNPRAQNTESRVSRQIQNGLRNHANEFHLLNRGLTITAHGADYDAKKQELSLQLSKGLYGLVDGGHTYSVIRENLAEAAEAAKDALKPKEDNGEKTEPVLTPEFVDKGFVHVEVMLGVRDDLLVDVARSRNTSAQVKDESLANLEGSFDWLKDVLDKTSFGSEVSYRENEDWEKFPIDVREIVALMTLFHPNFQDSEKPPILAYTSKGRCLSMFREAPEHYKTLSKIVPDILKLYDHVHLKFAEHFRTLGGLVAIEKNERQMENKLNASGIRWAKNGFPLLYARENATLLFPDGWLFPALSSLRALVSYKEGGAKWKGNPYHFFDKNARAVVSMTLDTSKALGRNPNAVGKHKPHWMQLHGHALNQYLRLLKVDIDREVNV